MSDEWLSARQAAKRLGITGPTVPTVARAADIRIRMIPGLPVTYSAADVALIVAESVKGNGPQTKSARARAAGTVRE